MDVGRKAASSRIEWLDTAKGLGILLVVIAHVWTRGAVRDAIYAFHMPLFFLLAGYVAHPRPAGDFVRRQLGAMAVPYIAFLLTIALADQWIEHGRHHLPLFRTWPDALWAIGVGGSELKGPFTIFWFVPCLMFARILQNFLLKLWPEPLCWQWAATMAGSLIFGMWIGAESNFSPLGLLSVPVALVLLWLGMLWRGMKDDHWPLLIALAISIAVLAVGHPVPLDMKSGDYGVPFLSLALSVVFSLGLCAVARRLAGVGILAFTGRQSLIIMYCHVPVIHYLAPYYPRPVLLILGVLLPLALQQILVRFAWGRRCFLGMQARRG